MGCLRQIFVQIGCLVVLVAALVFGFVYREQLGAVYRRARGLPPAADTSSFALPTADARRDVRDNLTRLARRDGPAYVDLTAAELASLIASLLSEAGGSELVDSVGVALAEDTIRVHGSLDLSRVPRGSLGPLGSSMQGRQPVTMAGTLRGDTTGLYWTLAALRIGDFPFPRSTIGPLLRSLRVRGADGATIRIPLEHAIGDVQVRRTAVRLYRVQP